MRVEIRTPLRAISTLVVLFVLVFGASLDVSAQGRSGWGRSHNRGRHLGWERGRRVGLDRRSDDSLLRRVMRRDRRSDRREFRRQQRRERSLFSGSDRSLLEMRQRQERAEFRSRQRAERDLFKQSHGGRGRH